MKIEDFINFKELFVKEKINYFQEGNLIEGKIIEVEDEFVLIQVKDLGIIKAQSEKPLHDFKGKILSFIIQESLPDKVYLKPIIDNVTERAYSSYSYKKEEYLIDILKEFNIKPSTTSIDFVERLVEFNLPINKESLVNGMGILDKLEELLRVKEDEIIVLANPKGETVAIGEEDIRNFLIVKENEDIYISDDSKKTINFQLKDWANNLVINEEDKGLLKTIIFFIKYNIKPSLNNIKNFIELKEDPVLFSKDFEILKEIIDNEFTNSNKKIIINSGDAKKTVDENRSSKYEDILNRILDDAKNYSDGNKDFKKDIENLVNKIELLKDINKELVFIYLPLKLDEMQDTVITLLKRNKKDSQLKDKINLFINLKTNGLGNIKISCLVSNNYIDIKLGGINKKDVELFRAREDELKALVETSGYEIRNIEYLLDKDYTILDSLTINVNTIYNLDVQV